MPAGDSTTLGICSRSPPAAGEQQHRKPGLGQHANILYAPLDKLGL
jgi:hypothetical protein